MLFGLRVEDALVSRMQQAARVPIQKHSPAVPAVLPHIRVDGRVGVDKRVGEPLLPLAPVDAEKFDEEGRDDVAHVVGEPAGRPELRGGGKADRGWMDGGCWE